MMAMMLFAPMQVFAYPEPSNYTNDWANVIDEDVEKKINEANNKLEETNGSQIFVVTVDFLDGEDIDDYAYNLFNEWNIGSAEYNNGVLLLLVIGEEDYYCLQGSGIEDTLSTGVLQNILDDYLEPDFAIGNYSDGVEKTFEQLYEKAIKSIGEPIDDSTNAIPIDPTPSQPSNNGDSSSGFGKVFGVMSTFIGIMITLVVIMVIVMILSSLFRPRYRTTYTRPRPYRRPFIFFGGPHYDRPPRPNNYNRPPGGTGSFGGGVHRSSGGFNSSRSSFGGSGRSSSSFGSGRSSFGGAGRSSGGFRGGGGGRSRGGGAGRR